MPGVQTLLPVMLDHAAAGRISYELLVQMTSENPARIFGVAGAGTVTPGTYADLALVDPKAQWEVTDAAMASKCGWTPYAGRTLTGRVVHTGEQAANIGNTLFLEEWTRFDRGARYVTVVGGAPLTFRVNLDNVADADYWASAFDSFRPDLQLGAPRTFKASVTYDF